MKYKIGFIGAGKMAEAIIRGVLKASLMTESDINVSDVIKERLDVMDSIGINTFNKNTEVVKNSDIIVLATKPDKIKSVLKDIKDELSDDKLVISIAAGITLNTLYSEIGNNNLSVIRVMPNTPALVGEAMSAYTYKVLKEEYKEFIEKFLNSFGISVYLEEKYFDAVTGLSGSGPAYAFMIINGLADGGVKMGLPKNVALKLAAQTLLGAAKLVLKTDLHPEQLKDMVSSPGGTTVEGTYILENNKIRAALIDAVEKATLKSKELGKK